MNFKKKVSEFFRQNKKKGPPDFEDIKNEIESKKREHYIIGHKDLLRKLLSNVKKVNFYQLVSNHNSEKSLKPKHYIVTVIEEILKLSKTYNWGLCIHHDRIYLFNGEYWDVIEENQIKAFLSEVAQRMGVDKYDSKFYEYKDKLVKQFYSEAYLPPPERQYDKIKINLKNGTFTISEDGFKLEKFDIKDFLTYQLPFGYDSKKEAPLFNQYLNQVLPDVSLQKILAEYIGYTFIPNLKLEKALLLYGNGANGKSVFFEIVSALIGKQNISNFSLESLTDEKGYSRATFENALLNYTSEISGRFKTSSFKQLVSGEPIEARLPYGKPFSIENYGKLLFNCNELPKDREFNHAFFRRFLIIPFNATIPSKDQDKKLASKIINNELSGVFNWVLQGLIRLLEQERFSESEVMTSLINNFKIESDSVLLFLDESDYESSSGYTYLTTVYDDYKEFCNLSGINSLGKSKFKTRLSNSGISILRKSAGYAVFVEKII